MQHLGCVYFVESAGKPLALNTAKLNRALVCFVLVLSSVWRPGIGGLEDMHWENSLRAVQSRGCRYESKHCPRAALTALVNNKPAKCYVYLLLCRENQVFRLTRKCWGRCAEVKEIVCFHSDFNGLVYGLRIWTMEWVMKLWQQLWSNLQGFTSLILYFGWIIRGISKNTSILSTIDLSFQVYT